MLIAVLSDKGYYCPYCKKFNGVNEGSSESIGDNHVYVTCGHCGKEAIADVIE